MHNARYAGIQIWRFGTMRNYAFQELSLLKCRKALIVDEKTENIVKQLKEIKNLSV